MVVDLQALVLPAFDGLDAAPIDGELGPWRAAYDLDQRVDVPGVEAPLRHDGAGLAVVPTGVGKVAAASTTTAVCASETVSLADSLVLSVGIAGAPPDLPIGSVVLADSIVDWDDKVRLDDEGTGEPIEPDPYTGTAGVIDLDSALVARAKSVGETVSLVGDGSTAKPTLTVGTNVCADELWHGRQIAARVTRFVAERDRGPYRATEMEDAGTARALRRFGLADRYLSVRGVSNHDRPEPGTAARDSFFGAEAADSASAFRAGLESAVRVARAIVDDAR
jgi:purine nucleoside permease